MALSLGPGEDRAAHGQSRLPARGGGGLIEEQRRELEGLRVRALECVAEVGLGLGGPELAATERSGRRLIELEPYSESGYRFLMEALERRDDVAEALRVYERLRISLRDELGVAPGAAAQALHKRLLEQRSAEV